MGGEVQREKKRERERESKYSVWSSEPNAGLDPTTLRSLPELKP